MDRGGGGGRGPARFPIRVWNNFATIDSIPRTTNAVEGYHNSLHSLFLSQHPTMWKLLDGFKKDMANHRKTLVDSKQPQAKGTVRPIQYETC